MRINKSLGCLCRGSTNDVVAPEERSDLGDGPGMVNTGEYLLAPLSTHMTPDTSASYESSAALETLSIEVHNPFFGAGREQSGVHPFKKQSTKLDIGPIPHIARCKIGNRVIHHKWREYLHNVRIENITRGKYVRDDILFNTPSFKSKVNELFEVNCHTYIGRGGETIVYSLTGNTKHAGNEQVVKIFLPRENYEEYVKVIRRKLLLQKVLLDFGFPILEVSTKEDKCKYGKVYQRKLDIEDQQSLWGISENHRIACDNADAAHEKRPDPSPTLRSYNEHLDRERKYREEIKTSMYRLFALSGVNCSMINEIFSSFDMGDENIVVSGNSSVIAHDW